MKEVVFTRIDDRLIHGQVMTRWLQHSQASEVVISDSKAAKDLFMASIMKSSMPAKIKLSILETEETVKYLSEEQKGSSKKVFLLVKTPMELAALVKAGIRLDKVNLGGIGARKDRKLLYRNISISPEEEQALTELQELGCDIQIQVLPDDSPVKLKKIYHQ